MKLARKPNQTTRQYLKYCISVKWPDVTDAEKWWTKFAAVRRRKLIACFNAQGGKCFYCREDCWLQTEKVPNKPNRYMATLEHLLPQVLNGFDNPHNLRMACNFCNSMRGELPDWQEFKRLRILAGNNPQLATARMRLWLFNKPSKAVKSPVDKSKATLRLKLSALKLACLWIESPTIFELFKPFLKEFRERDWK